MNGPGETKMAALSEEMDDRVIIHQIQYELPILGSEVYSFAELHEKWALYFNNLILNDFAALVSLLYRIDISEIKLRNLLKENSGSNAGELIATLVMERIAQKIKTREAHRLKTDSFPGTEDAEKW
jgi:hypothetical protein